MFEVEEPAAAMSATKAGQSSTAAPLALLPKRFRKLLWIKRGDFAIATAADDDYESSASGATGRVRYMIEHVLYPKQRAHLKGIGAWPEEWLDAPGAEEADESSVAAGAAAGTTASAVPSGLAASAAQGMMPDSDCEEEEDWIPTRVNRRGRAAVGEDSDDTSSDEDSSYESSSDDETA